MAKKIHSGIRNRFMTTGILMVIVLLVAYKLQSDSSHVDPKESAVRFLRESRMISEYAQTRGMDAAYKYFSQTSLDPVTGHDVAHFVGNMLYEHIGKHGIDYCDDSYQWGCFHGFLARMISGESVVDPGLCAASNENELACIHGAGHGLMVHHGYTTEGIQQALDDCRKFEPYSDSCTTGVFMEYNTGLTGSLMAGNVDRSTPEQDHVYEPCQSLAEKYRIDCYLDQPPRWFAYVTQDAAEIAKLCTGIEDTSEKMACFGGIGRITPDGSSSIWMMRDYCMDIFDESGRHACMIEAINGLKGSGIPGGQIGCLPLPAPDRWDCLDQFRR